MKTAIVPSPIGLIKLSATKEGLRSCSLLLEDSQEAVASELTSQESTVEESKIHGSTTHDSNTFQVSKEAQISHPVLVEAILQLKEYFEGNRTDFNLPFDLEGTDFQKKVWNSLCEIPFGTTWTYAQQATHLGDLNAIRAVASANGKNPLGIIIPCHRVIGSNGSLTGFAWGIEKKKWLLEHEGLAKQLRLF